MLKKSNIMASGLASVIVLSTSSIALAQDSGNYVVSEPETSVTLDSNGNVVGRASSTFARPVSDSMEMSTPEVSTTVDENGRVIGKASSIYIKPKAELKVGSGPVSPEELKIGSGPVSPEELKIGSGPVSPEELKIGSGPVSPEELKIGSGPVSPEELKVGSGPVSPEEKNQTETVSVKPKVVRRASGNTLEETTVAVSEATKGWGNIILARADNLSDAIAGIPLAKRINATVLLVEPNSVEPVTLKYIKENLPAGSTITILGGTKAISHDVEQLLKLEGYLIRRISGTNRFETSEKIFSMLGQPADVLVSDGNADSKSIISASAIAGRGGGVLYSHGTDKELVNILNLYKNTTVLTYDMRTRDELLGAGLATNRVLNVGSGASDGSDDANIINAFSNYNLDIYNREQILITNPTNSGEFYATAVASARSGSPIIVTNNVDENIVNHINNIGAGIVTLVGGENSFSSAMASGLATRLS